MCSRQNNAYHQNPFKCCGFEICKPSYKIHRLHYISELEKYSESADFCQYSS